MQLKSELEMLVERLKVCLRSSKREFMRRFTGIQRFTSSSCIGESTYTDSHVNKLNDVCAEAAQVFAAALQDADGNL